MKKSLLDAFGIKKEEKPSEVSVNNEIQENKNLSSEIKNKIILNLIEKGISKDKSINEINDEINNVLKGYNLNNLERNSINSLIENEINGYGPLTELLLDKNVTEIMVNAPDKIYIEVNGKLIKEESIYFINNDHIIRTIQKIIEPYNRIINTSNPIVDLTLKDGSRINAIIPPLSLKGPVITIKKYKEPLNNIEDLLRMGTMTPYMARFLEACVHAKLNIIICGKNSSGKTSLLNTLSNFIDYNERIVTIEETQKLKLNQSNVVSLGLNYESEGKITIRDLIKNSLKIRPDRIIIDEVHSKESFDILELMNMGYEGSIFTLHANDSKDCLKRLETMILMSGFEIPVNVIQDYIINTIDLVVNIEKLSDDKIKIVSISELNEIKNGNITLRDIFVFKQIGITSSQEVNGEFIRYDFIPKVLNKIKSRIKVDIDYIFRN